MFRLRRESSSSPAPSSPAPSSRALRRGKTVAASALTALMATVGAIASSTPAAAGTYYNTCGQRITQQTFSAYGDTNEYFLPQEGDYETSSLSGWVLYNAGPVLGNNPFYLSRNRYDARSLKINPSGSAGSEVICVVPGEDSIRFAYRSPGVSASALRVDITVISALGTASASYTVSGSTAGWAVSPRMAIPNRVDYTGAQSLKIRFTPTGTAATWQVDDVYVDPWRTL